MCTRQRTPGGRNVGTPVLWYRKGCRRRHSSQSRRICYQDPLIPAVDSVFIIIVAGLSASFCVEFDWKRDKNWLSVWLTLLPMDGPLEPLLPLESPGESAVAAWA